MISAPCSLASITCVPTNKFGNTCYVNSVLQALYYCRPFREAVFRNIEPSSSRSDASPKSSAMADAQNDSFFGALSRLFHHISRSATEIREHGATASKANVSVDASRRTPGTFMVDPNVIRQFLTVLRRSNDSFNNTMHQDAHELLNFILNKACDDLEEPQAGDVHGNTAIHRLFQGVLTNETRCLSCETVTSRNEAFLDLSVNIEPNTSISSCLRRFSDSEMLSGRNKYFCDRCSCLQEAEKRMKILCPPSILALHLKRFKWDERVQAYVKLSSRVVFPLELRLFNTSEHAEDPDRLYELCAVVVHSGEGSNQGHYVSVVRIGALWAVFDDDVVYFLPESQLSRFYEDTNDSGSAYVLFYQAKDLDPAQQKPAQPAPVPQAPVQAVPPVLAPPAPQPAVQQSLPRASAATRMTDWLPRRSSQKESAPRMSFSAVSESGDSPRASRDETSSRRFSIGGDVPRVLREETPGRRFSLGRSALSRTLRLGREK